MSHDRGPETQTGHAVPSGPETQTGHAVPSGPETQTGHAVPSGPETQTWGRFDQASLFVELSHRLRSYSDTSLLILFLNWGLTETKAFACSAEQIGRDELGGAFTRYEIRKAIERLSDAGLLAVRVHANTNREFRVNTKAVLELLASPIPQTNFFPGRSRETVPFLSLWAAAARPSPSPNFKESEHEHG